MQMTAEKWLYMAFRLEFYDNKNINLIVANKQFLTIEEFFATVLEKENLKHAISIVLSFLYVSVEVVRC